ncbi:MAG: GTP-binding protein gtr2 [Sarcosagium campestre]|nr:MAG: GTP-binding protein gtr2 [Sarcosagium campestre]
MALLRGSHGSPFEISHEGDEEVNIKSKAVLTLERALQNLPNLNADASTDDENKPKFHTGRLPNKEGKPKLLLMGQRRSGKSSISSVVFHKMPPAETLFLESTSRIQKDSMHSFMDFQVWDFPGQLDFFDPAFDVDGIFSGIGALIWVIDAQDDYLEALSHLNAAALHLQQSYPAINIEVFIHKVDGLSDDYKFDTHRDIVQRVQDELSDNGFENAPVNFHLTSIYDHSIFEAFSKVCQKLIPQLPTLEGILNLLCANCRMEKAYLFDVLSKIYIATDTSPVDMASYEVCSDYIDVIVDISEIYGWERPPPDDEAEQALPDAESTILLQGPRFMYLREINK